MTAHEELFELASLYALDALDGEERAQVEGHLAGGCADCEAEVRRVRALGDALAEGVELVSPSAEARNALFDRVRADAGSPEPVARIEPRSADVRPAKWNWGARLAVAASVVAALIGGATAVWLAGLLEDERSARVAVEERLASERSRLLAQLDAERAERSQVDLQVAELQRLADTVAAPTLRTVLLAGQGPAAEANARAFLDPERRQLVLYVHDLPPLPAGKSYQLWVIVDGTPVSAGVFAVDEAGHARHDLSGAPELERTPTIAVTIEPEGGVPQPTGPIVLVGT